MPDRMNSQRATKNERMLVTRKAPAVLKEIAFMLLESISYSLK